MAANLERRYTLEEYFELERTSNERFEFWNGEVFSMSGGSQAHDRILVNCLVYLSTRLDSKVCRVVSSDMRIKVPAAPPYRYADLSALCGEAQFEEIGGVDALTNAQLIVEVLPLDRSLRPRRQVHALQVNPDSARVPAHGATPPARHAIL
jgi:Uma2 family endonuclease